MDRSQLYKIAAFIIRALSYFSRNTISKYSYRLSNKRQFCICWFIDTFQKTTRMDILKLSFISFNQFQITITPKSILQNFMATPLALNNNPGPHCLTHSHTHLYDCLGTSWYTFWQLLISTLQAKNEQITFFNSLRWWQQR